MIDDINLKSSSSQVVFGFDQYTSLSDVDSAVGNVQLMDGSCNAGEALYQCGSALFSGSTTGRARVLIVLMAGKSQEDLGVGNAAAALKNVGVKIIAVGMGGAVDNAQLSAMAFSASYVLSTAAFSGLASIGQSVSTLVSQGKYKKTVFNIIIYFYIDACF